MEIRIVKGFENYEINEYGRIWSKKSGKYLKPKDHNGYGQICLYDGYGNKNWWLLHRLVAKAFHGTQPRGKPFVLHYDGDKSNSHYTNLRYGTSEENAEDAVRLGEHDSKLNKHKRKEIVEMSKTKKYTQQELADLYDVHKRTIVGILSKAGVRVYPEYDRLTEKQKLRITHLRNRGETFKRIAEIIGCSITSARRICKDRGIK